MINFWSPHCSFHLHTMNFSFVPDVWYISLYNEKLNILVHYLCLEKGERPTYIKKYNEKLKEKLSL